jgi:putative spermidine/putrescine transport system permease protein
MVGRTTRVVLVIWVVGVLLFLALPLATIVLYAFGKSNVQTWPIGPLTTHWFAVAWDDPQVRAALWLSVKAGLAATVIALALGSAAAFGVHRFRFFGRETVSLLLVLPLALPGIITGLALKSAFNFIGLDLSLFTIVIGHATFCIVVVYNNVIARLRRVSGSVNEASMDLGADGLQTFRFVTLPMLSTAIISGALLAFALSFDEVIVTVFTAGAQNTLPLWIFGAIRLGQQLPEVNVVVVFVIVLTVIPIFLAARLTGGGGVTRASASTAAEPPGGTLITGPVQGT